MDVRKREAGWRGVRMTRFGFDEGRDQEKTGIASNQTEKDNPNPGKVQLLIQGRLNSGMLQWFLHYILYEQRARHRHSYWNGRY